MRAINPRAESVLAAHGEVEPDMLFGRGMISSASSAGEFERWLSATAGATRAAGDIKHGEHPHAAHAHAVHDERVYTFSVTREGPVTKRSLALWLSMLAGFRGANLLRVKGLVNVEGRPVAINAVQSVLHEPVELATWPSADMRSRIVFIVRDIAQDDLQRSVDALWLADTSASGGLLDREAYAQFLRMAGTFM